MSQKLTKYFSFQLWQSICYVTFLIIGTSENEKNCLFLFVFEMWSKWITDCIVIVHSLSWYFSLILEIEYIRLNTKYRICKFIWFLYIYLSCSRCILISKNMYWVCSFLSHRLSKCGRKTNLRERYYLKCFLSCKFLYANIVGWWSFQEIYLYILRLIKETKIIMMLALLLPYFKATY